LLFEVQNNRREPKGDKRESANLGDKEEKTDVKEVKM